MSEGPGGNTTAQRGLVDVVIYAAARLLLLVVLSGAIYGVARLVGVDGFPLVVAMLFALIIAMPLGIWLLAPLRRRATAALAVSGERRRRERDQLRARLRGETLAGAPDGADDEDAAEVADELPDEK
ncbi:DUF4229 domain-containing protein [Mycobacterium sp.]|uniref:DUF4229 domain-containing protein n=1 Tax=Mycobacterium sp. TaxID=1785 RepID=UPI003C73893F